MHKRAYTPFTDFLAKVNFLLSTPNGSLINCGKNTYHRKIFKSVFSTIKHEYKYAFICFNRFLYLIYAKRSRSNIITTAPFFPVFYGESN